MTNRRTSNYTLHVPGSTSTHLDELTRFLASDGRPVNDRQTHGLTFRATSDRDAVLTVRDAMAGLSDPWTLTTGLGIHRREVTPPAGPLPLDWGQSA